MDMGNSTHHGDMDMGGDDGDYMMMMWFHFAVNEIVLFKWWHPKDAGGMAGTCAILFVAAFLYEALKYFRECLYRRLESRQVERRVSTGGASGSREVLSRRPQAKSWTSGVFNVWHVVQTVLHAVQFLVSYLLMLVFMTYNVYLCLAVVLGATLGFFLFGWRKNTAADVTEHCH